MKNFEAQTYLVGGAVRDRLLGLEVSEQDWVVTGSSPEQMVARNFRPVGKEFPVFLHPDTGEEYALARTERKSGHGYQGFTFHTGPDVSLEDDLQRRDLTINAMAEDERRQRGSGRNASRRLARRIRRYFSNCCANAPPCRRSCPRSMHCSAFRNRRAFIRKSTPGCIP